MNRRRRRRPPAWARRRLRRRRILRALAQAGRAGVKRITFSRTRGGRAEIEVIHSLMRDAQRTRATQTGRTQTMTRPHTPTTPPDHRARALVLPEGRAIARAASGIEDWDPASASEVHEMLVTLATATAMFGTAVLTLAETLARKGADPMRIVNPLIGCAEAIGGAAHTFHATDRMFLRLYAGDLEQEQSPAAPMVYAEARR